MAVAPGPAPLAGVDAVTGRRAGRRLLYCRDHAARAAAGGMRAAAAAGGGAEDTRCYSARHGRPAAEPAESGEGSGGAEAGTGAGWEEEVRCAVPGCRGPRRDGGFLLCAPHCAAAAEAARRGGAEGLGGCVWRNDVGLRCAGD